MWEGYFRVKYDWNKPPEPQLVPFRDFVGVNIAPVSKKTAVKYWYTIVQCTSGEFKRVFELAWIEKVNLET